MTNEELAVFHRSIAMLPTGALVTNVTREQMLALTRELTRRRAVARLNRSAEDLSRYNEEPPDE